MSEIVPLTKPFTEVGDSDHEVNNYRSTSNIDDNEHSTPNINEWVELEDEMSDCIPEMDSIDDNLFMEAPYQDDDHELPHNLTINDEGPNLYPNSQLTTVQAVSILTSWFSAFPGTSKRSFSRLLKILNSIILPKGNSLPTSYAQAISMLKPYMNTVREYHCCVNDCILYRNTETTSYKSLLKCPVCGEDRYKPNTKIARKTFKYYPVGNRITRLYGNSTTSKLLQSHGPADSEEQATAVNNGSTLVRNIHDSKAWTDLYAITGKFHGERRSLTFALCLDGVNPFAKEKISYSMCPMILVPLNLPQYCRNSSQSLMLTGIIPGPAEVKNTDPYIDVLVDELLQINGSTVYDSYRNEYFNLEITILLNILDYPGHNKVFHCQGMWSIVFKCMCYMHA